MRRSQGVHCQSHRQHRLPYASWAIVSPGSFAHQLENVRSAVFSRAPLHFRQFLRRNQERGENCGQPAVAGVMTPQRSGHREQPQHRVRGEQAQFRSNSPRAVRTARGGPVSRCRFELEQHGFGASRLALSNRLGSNNHRASHEADQKNKSGRERCCHGISFDCG